jgi:hypothetical protein
MSKIVDITGNRYGRLVVISFNHLKNRIVYWNVICDCGKEKVIPGGGMKDGSTKSCGCYMLDQIVLANKKHGEAHKTKEWRAWRNMKTRCLNPANHAYKNYGGRGILICESWLNSYENFLFDMGRCPKNFSLERENNEIGYCKENCKWASRLEQSNNRRNVIKITHNGRTLTTSQWAREIGISTDAMSGRLKRHGLSCLG